MRISNPQARSTERGDGQAHAVSTKNVRQVQCRASELQFLGQLVSSGYAAVSSAHASIGRQGDLGVSHRSPLTRPRHPSWGAF
jgi:hypothetical protein